MNYERTYHPGHRAWIHRWNEGGVVYEFAHMDEHLPSSTHDDAVDALRAKLDCRADAERMYRADIETHKEALRHALQREQNTRKQYELMMEHMTKMAAMQLQPPVWMMKEKDFHDYITPTKKETKLNVKENAGAMLGQVQAHLKEVEGDLASTKAQLYIRTKELAQERGLRRQQQEHGNHRALLVNLDGSMKNISPRADYENGMTVPARRMRFEELDGPMPGSLLGTAADYWAAQSIRAWRREYRLMFSQGNTHVYQEIG